MQYSNLTFTENVQDVFSYSCSEFVNKIRHQYKRSDIFIHDQ